MNAGRGDVAGALETWLAQRLGAAEVAVVDLHRHTEGWSWQTYTLDARWTDPSSGRPTRRGFAVRVEPADGLLAPYDIEGQYTLHELVRQQSDVPMPDLYWLERDASVLGGPFYVMERMRGRVPVQWRGNDPEVFPTPSARQRIGLQFVDIEAAIHSIDWRGRGLDGLGAPVDPGAGARAQVERWVDYYERSALVELPVLRQAITWLRHNIAYSGRLVLCHGDYRIGNFMVADGAINAVFDWELAHIGDPVEDIAYSGLPLFRGRNPRLSQLLDPQEYFDRYAERTGLAVDPDVFHFWTVCGLVKAAASHVRACRAYEEGRVDDLRLAAMGHQVHYVLVHLVRELGLRVAA